MAIKCPNCQHENPDDTVFCGKCATRLPSPEKVEVTETLETPKEELTTGSTFADRYQIIEKLGKGGMGRVYKAHDIKIKEKIALKLIKPEIAKDKKTIERFSNEIRLARKIRHKNVCGMFDLGEEKGTHYITMEFVPGEDLRSSIRRFGQLPTGKSISIAKQICEGLAEAHRLGVVHRDLKSNNIMIDKEGNARIMDFGIARSLEAKGITGAGVMIGTPEYMSPEQVEAKEVDQRSDIYSLGIIMYEMLTGKLPFEADTPFAVGVKHKSEAPKDPKEINPQIPDDLSHVILKCLEKEKERRYQSANEVRFELEKIEQGLPTTDRVIPKKKPLTSKEVTVTFGLKKLYIPVLIILGLVIALVIVWQMFSEKQMSITVIPFSDEGLQQDQEHLGSGVADDITSRLFKLKKWKVVNSPSAMFYKETEKTYKEIGKELAVTHILTGTIREERGKIRITARLIKVKDNSIVWSETYDEELQSVFNIQSSIARNVASAIRKELSSEEKSLLEKKTTENLKAYELYTLGRYHWNKRTVDDFTQAIEYYQEAIDLDPDYALAYAGIAESYVLMKEFTLSSIPSQVFFQKAREAAMKALELDDSLAGAYTALGYMKIWDWDFEGAEKDYKKAIELNPSYATAHHWYAELLCWQARLDDALDEILLAQKLDPMSKVISVNVGRMHLYRREFDLALEALQSSKKMDPEWGVLAFFLGQAYFYNSMYEEALAEFDKLTQWALESVFSTATFGELIKYLLKNTDALEQSKKILESAGEYRGSLDEFRNQLEYLSVNPEALSAAAKDLRQAWGEHYKSYLHGVVYAKIGKEKEVEQILEKTIELGKMGYAQHDYDLAVLYFLLGKDDLGFKHLDKAIETKQAGCDLKVDPLFDDVRSDPRFQALLKKMGLD